MSSATTDASSTREELIERKPGNMLAELKKPLNLALAVVSGVMLILSIVFICLYATLDESFTAKYSYPGPDSVIKNTEYPDGEIGGPAKYNGSGNVKASPYFPTYDYFTGVNPTGSLELITGVKTAQMSTERTSGAIASQIVLNYYGVTDETEVTLTNKMGIVDASNPRPDGSYGATTQSIVDLFLSKGFVVESSKGREDPNAKEFLDPVDFQHFVEENIRQKRPIIAQCMLWGGSWSVIVGYDTMGNPDTNGHVLILAEPRDPFDHYQDGYISLPAERFYSSFVDYGSMPADERVQQYVVPYRA